LYATVKREGKIMHRHVFALAAVALPLATVFAAAQSSSAVPPQLPADQAMPLCAAHSITISPTDRAADISLPSCTR